MYFAWLLLIYLCYITWTIARNAGICKEVYRQSAIQQRREQLPRLQPHVLESGNYSRFQSAYRSGYSTETALLKIMNDIRTAAGEGRCTALLALDISAAFDAVNYSLLCQRFQHTFGMNGSALDWLRSFVSGRSQYVAAGGERSVTAACESGVPRVQCLEPAVLTVCCSRKQHCRSPSCTLMTFKPTLLSSLSVLIVCFSWLTALMTSSTSFLRMVCC